MGDEVRERLRTLLDRAGLGGSSAKLVLVAGVAVALVASWAAWRWWPAAGGEGTIVYEQPVVSAATVPTSQPAVVESVTAAIVTVHVAGSVRHPGVYRVADGSRVTDAVDAAGGLLGDAVPERVNLARVVSDGEQVLIPSEDDPEVAGGAAAAAVSGASVPGAAGGVVNINTADVALLDSLPGVGPATAQKIVDDRTANGPFARVEDLGRVSGIGPKKLEELTPRATVK